MPNKEDELGGLWEKQTRNGDTYLNGKIGDQAVVIFRNTYKQEGERTPDWRVYKSQPRPQDGQQAAPQPERRPAQQPLEAPPESYPEDDIPF